MSWMHRDQDEQYGRGDDDDDDEMVTEDTAMLCTAATTEIVITPMSPNTSTNDLNLIGNDENTTVVDLHAMDLLKPEARTSVKDEA